MKSYYVYIITNQYNTVLYTGVTSDLIKRIWQHKNKQAKGFSEKYNLNKLVYYEEGSSIEGAILLEKKLKRWRREWKEELINKQNSDWRDLYEDLL